ncbi:Coenzyme F420 hydrogenase/dehydrogenase, beta subunit C-terminal domain [Echinicola marina]|uniref:Coenzyme F420 hydrogenase/dehydrogenase, beta subunit C-terminal domain n=1 Tax=Echinicola marina TaxID=2859768 RepID=UPI001CF6F163|nr:Coenzyme F420 hydrogenase/dehydrogenase, beta subunit C-terminal domain [Echinicola marina]UCS93981.1 Coenzyme F420 hydrogenase/dehydrogenase, beta subunit C-terminal domain [Echinicola marina]
MDIKNVIEGDYCVGCGACAYKSGGSMRLNKYGEYFPDLADDSFNDKNLDKICPFLKPELNEDVLANQFLDGRDGYLKGLGFYNALFAGYVNEGNYRSNGTSGGMGTWIGAELLKNNLIDGIIHVKKFNRSNQSDPYYAYAISRTVQENLEGAKTKYHVVEISNILNEVRKYPGRYLFIGVPCLVKAIRRIQTTDGVIKERIAFTISLVCGHFKSVNWTKSLAWGAGVNPQELNTFQYRTKEEGIAARKYVFRAFKKNSYVQKDAAQVVGGKFNQGAMMLNACNFCDDVVGETADMTIGDAWLPRFESDDNGTNLIIIRNQELRRIITKAINEERLKLIAISEKEAYQSQSGGFRQRGEGLSYRLAKKQNAGEWAPEKRVSPGEFKVPLIRQMVYSKRMEISSITKKSFVKALEKDDFSVYADTVERKLRNLRKIEIASTFFRSVITHAKVKVLKRFK